MKMIDAKKEIADKMFVGAPLSLDAMMCAMVAIQELVEKHGESADVEVSVDVADIEKEKATERLSEELKNGVESAYNSSWLSADDVRNMISDVGWGV